MLPVPLGYRVPVALGAGALAAKEAYDYLTDEDEEALAQTVEPNPPEGYKTEKTAAELLAEPVDEKEDVEAGATAPTQAGSDIVISDGAWKYQVLGGGKIKFIGVPPGSKMMGKTLDPEIIKQMPPGPARDRLQRAYDSIKSVAQGGKPLMRLPSKPKPKAAPTQTALPEQAAQMGARPQADAPPPAVQPTPAPVEVPTNQRMGRTLGFLGKMRDAIPNYWDKE